MKSLVVLFAVAALAAAAPRQEKRSLGHVVAYGVPSAVSHSSRVDVRSSPALVAPVQVASVVQEPVVATRTLVASPVYASGAVSHQSRVDVKTSPALVSETAYGVVSPAAVVSEPLVVDARTVYSAPAASVYSVPAASVYSVPAASVYSVPAASVYSVPAATVYSGGSAVSHQSRVDVQSSPAVVTEQLVGPAVVDARSVVVPSVYSTW